MFGIIEVIKNKLFAIFNKLAHTLSKVRRMAYRKLVSSYKQLKNSIGIA